MLVPRSASADEPAPPPVVVPPDAIIVPYDPATQNPLKALETPAHAKPGEKQIAKPFGMEKSQRLLVPYNKYLELQHAAHPDQIVRPAPPAEYALSAGRFSARLDGGESLLIEGNLDVNVLVDHPVSIPLTLSGGVLTKADVDGKPGMAAMLRQSEPTKRKADENPFADHPPLARTTYSTNQPIPVRSRSRNQFQCEKMPLRDRPTVQWCCSFPAPG